MINELLELDLEDVHVAINLVISGEEVNMMSWDGTMLKLMDYIRCGMPDSGLKLDKSLREYHRLHHDPHEVNGVLLYRDPIVVQEALQSKVLIGIHAAQQGVVWLEGLTRQSSGLGSTRTSLRREVAARPVYVRH